MIPWVELYLFYLSAKRDKKAIAPRRRSLFLSAMSVLIPLE
ncbi:hypothetical protein [Laspinema olomoucense]|nr:MULTISPECIES: hypothetical protein [unclassified Laspinema]